MDLAEYFRELSDNVNKLSEELEILVSSAANSGNTSSETMMDSLVATNQNEMRTKSPLYSDVSEAEDIESDPVRAYINQRIGQVFGEE